MLTSTVPLWVLLLISAVFLATAAIGVTYHIRGRFPFTDPGFRIFPCKDERALRLMLDIAGSCGLSVMREITTPAIRRVLLSDGMTVLNVIKDPVLVAKMGGQALPGLALVTDTPQLAASCAEISLADRGYPSRILGELDPEAGRGNLVFVQTDALPGALLVFRKHIMKMPKPAGNTKK